MVGPLDLMTLTLTSAKVPQAVLATRQETLSSLAGQLGAIQANLNSSDQATEAAAQQQVLTLSKAVLITTAALLGSEFIVESDQFRDTTAQQFLTAAYTDSPRMLAVSMSLGADATGSQASFNTGFDILRNQFRSYAMPGQAQ